MYQDGYNSILILAETKIILTTTWGWTAVIWFGVLIEVIKPIREIADSSSLVSVWNNVRRLWTLLEDVDVENYITDTALTVL